MKLHWSLIPFLVFSACASPQTTRGGRDYPDKEAKHSPSKAELQEKAAFREIQDLYAKGAHLLALEKVKVFERKYSPDAFGAQVKNIEGLSLLLIKRPAEAIASFQDALRLDSREAFRAFVLFNLTMAQFENHQLEDAKATLARIQPDLMNAETQAKYLTLQARLKEGGAVSPHAAVTAPLPEAAMEQGAVGVLLPLQGKFAAFGEKSLQGITLAFRIFNNDEPDSKVTLHIEDSGETPEQAVAALEKLYYKHHVMAVLGPLLSKGVDAVTKRAEELSLPLLPLSQQTGVVGDYLFPAALTPKLQADEIARYALQNLGIQKFAILHPRDRFGEQYRETFWDAVEAGGGEVTAIESYAPDETDFRQTVDKLAGLYYTQARQRELDALAEERKVNQIKKRTRKTEQYFSLKPIVDFEAVFIPDEPKVVAQILPTFAYRDVDKVRFLGTSIWNSPDLITRAQNYAEGSFFVDVFHAESEALSTRNFVTRFQKTVGVAPGAVEAVAFDAASLLDEVLKSTPFSSRAALRDKLKTFRSYPGATGILSYKDGQFVRNLNILTVRGGKIINPKGF